MTQSTLAPFERAVRHFGIDLSLVKLYCTTDIPQTFRESVLLYVGPDQAERQAVANFQTWLAPWLEERRRDIAAFVGRNAVAEARDQIYQFAGATEVLRVLGSWGTLQWSIALNMVGQLAADAHQYGLLGPPMK